MLPAFVGVDQSDLEAFAREAHAERESDVAATADDDDVECQHCRIVSATPERPAPAAGPIGVLRWPLVPIVSPNVRLRVPEHFEVGEHSIVDDFCYFSTRVRIGDWSHVATGCSVSGGPDRQFTLGDYSSLSAGVRVWCTSNDFVNDVITIGAVPGLAGDVSFGDYTGVGANAVVMPQNAVPDGVAIGALSFVPADFEFEPWTVYAGVPIRPLRTRNREAVLAQVRQLSSRASE